jgi:hypothetical protein
MCWLTMLLLANPVGAAPSIGAPADTIVGEAHLTRLFTRGICEQIALESRHQDLAVLTQEQGMALLQDMLSVVIVRDSVSFKDFIARAPNADAAVQRVCIQAVLGLAVACPSSYKLVTKMGVQMAQVDTTLSVEQQQVLRASARIMCEQLVAANARKDFNQRPAAERIMVHKQIVQRVLVLQAQALVAAFGQEMLTDAQLENKMRTNIDRLMFEECPALTGMLRVDQGMARLQAQKNPAPRPAKPVKAAAPHGRKK